MESVTVHTKRLGRALRIHVAVHAVPTPAESDRLAQRLEETLADLAATETPFCTLLELHAVCDLALVTRLTALLQGKRDVIRRLSFATYIVAAPLAALLVDVFLSTYRPHGHVECGTSLRAAKDYCRARTPA